MKVRKDIKVKFKQFVIYDPDHPSEPTLFKTQSSFEATKFMNEKDYHVVYIKDCMKTKTQYWGVRTW